MYYFESLYVGFVKKSEKLELAEDSRDHIKMNQTFISVAKFVEPLISDIANVGNCTAENAV